jgi:uncharacterized protein (TIGR02453 family)
MAFKGFPKAALSFYAGLEGDNTTTYWAANKHVYEEAVKGSMLALAEALGEEFDPPHIFRPYRDTRFSKDKSPYKTACGAVHERDGGAMNYVQISSSGLFVGTGMYVLAKDQLVRFREAIADDESGPAFVAAVDDTRGARLDVGSGMEPPLTTAPRGYPKDHPRIEWLRWKAAIASKDFGAPAWLHTAAAAARVRAAFAAAASLNTWLEQHVGPSTEPPPEW